MEGLGFQITDSRSEQVAPSRQRFRPLVLLACEHFPAFCLVSSNQATLDLNAFPAEIAQIGLQPIAFRLRV